MTNTTKTTPEFNLQNWSGNCVTVDYTERADGTITFDYYGSTFTLAAFENCGYEFLPTSGMRTMTRTGESDELTTVYLDDDVDQHAVILAVRWIVINV
jgi:hypothetical protein